MQSYHEGAQSTWVLYDLGDASAWQRAGDELEAWGKNRTKIHALGTDHILVEFYAGGARDLEGTA